MQGFFQRRSVNISPSIFFWCLNESSSLDGSFEKPQLTFSFEIIKISCGIALLF